MWQQQVPLLSGSWEKEISEKNWINIQNKISKIKKNTEGIPEKENLSGVLFVLVNFISDLHLSAFCMPEGIC